MRNVHLITKEQEGADVLHQYLYITSDEEIKEGNYVIWNDKVYKDSKRSFIGVDYSQCKKIILTDNPDLITEGVQAIDNEFLEWFVKNPSCEFVEVGYGWIRLTETDNEGYWVSIPDKQFEMQQQINNSKQFYMEKKRNLWVIPTDKPSRLKRKNDEFDYSPAMMFIEEKNWKNQYIYITNDEEIEEGDYGYNLISSTIDRFTKSLLSNKKYYKKIILTTDPELIANGVQAINDKFLEWFIANPSCEQVEIYQDKKDYGSFQWYSEYKIIIPKEEPKQEFLEKISSIDLSPEFQQLISDNLDDLTSYEPKQETLEEVIKVERSDLYNKIHSIVKQIPREDVETDAMDASSCAYDIEQLFYKWQQERMYSEEEVLKILHNYRNHFELYRNIQVLPNMFFSWFEQFKKKQNEKDFN